MNIGVVIGRYNTDSNRLEYLLDEKGKYIHFYSVGEASKYLEDNDINTSEQKDCYILQYQTFCLNCGKEYFLNPSDTFVDELGRGYYCIECDSSFDVI